MAKLTDRTALVTPADGDFYVTTDVSDTTDAATGTDKKITWANIKAALASVFVSKVGTPADNQVGVWTGDGTIEGTAGLTFSANVLGVGTAAIGTVQSNGNFDLVLQTGNATTGNITLENGANGNIIVSPNGGGSFSATFGSNYFDVYSGGSNITFDANASDGSSYFINATAGDTYMSIADTSTGASGPRIDLYHNTASPAAGDIVGQIRFRGRDSSVGTENYAIIKGVIIDETATSEDGKIVFRVKTAGTESDEVELTGAALYPTTNDGLALGNTTQQFSDLFLAEGGVINWDNGDATLTQAGDVVTLAGADLKVTTPGNVSTSVITTDATQTLTNKTLTSPTLTTPSAFTTGGTITLAENTSIALDPAGSADGKYSGITVAGTAGAALAFGDLCYLAVADSRWELCDADAAATGNALLGMCVLAAAGDASATTMLLYGTCRADAKFPALTIGAAVYLGETAGAIQTAIPTGADNVIRVVGHALTADEIMFNPSQDHQISVA